MYPIRELNIDPETAAGRIERLISAIQPDRMMEAAGFSRNALREPNFLDTRPLG
jgi:hypothetical protein